MQKWEFHTEIPTSNVLTKMEQFENGKLSLRFTEHLLDKITG